jgi:hypothetical protein
MRNGDLLENSSILNLSHQQRGLVRGQVEKPMYQLVDFGFGGSN